MKIRVLGCGGSFGSPLAWGRNGNIDINNTHNYRTRSSVLININDQNKRFHATKIGLRSSCSIKFPINRPTMPAGKDAQPICHANRL